MKFSDLCFIRIIDPNFFRLIPKYLVEQIKNRDFEVDKLYELAPLLLTIPFIGPQGRIVAVPNPFHQFYALATEAGKAKGFLWLTIDPLRQRICINVLSVDREYQDESEPTALKGTVDFIRTLPEYEKFKKPIMCSTQTPKIFEEQIGAKRSKEILMEVDYGL